LTEFTEFTEFTELTVFPKNNIGFVKCYLTPPTQS
jgi:hypothetical protein